MFVIFNRTLIGSLPVCIKNFNPNIKNFQVLLNQLELCPKAYERTRRTSDVPINLAEDISLSRIAEERLRTLRKTLTHEEIWD